MVMKLAQRDPRRSLTPSRITLHAQVYGRERLRAS